ncbi:MAG TPA: AraC family transcriptional regulator [Kofleriaceae bacterium]|nr:AraC family transcriptional regulator [Kofleriaceae bacterium]
MDDYREWAPAPDLRDHVACTWQSIVAADTRVPVIPDGCVDVIVVDDEPPHIAGPATRTVWIEVAAGARITGVRFRPGAAAEVLRTSLVALCDEHVELAAVCAAPDDVTPTGLVQWTRRRLARRGPRPVLSRAAEVLANADTIDVVVRELGWSVRQLRRLFIEAYGYGPKLAHRILRLQHAIRLAHEGTCLAMVAALAGYADQAHLTREMRALTDLAPRAFLARADPRVGTWMADLFKTPRTRDATLHACRFSSSRASR